MPGTRAGPSSRVKAGRKAAAERKKRVPLRYPLRERINVLRRLDTFMEGALKSEINGAIAKTNLSIATIPLGFGGGMENGRMVYASDNASLIVFYWQRLPTGGLAVKYLAGAG